MIFYPVCLRKHSTKIFHSYAEDVEVAVLPKNTLTLSLPRNYRTTCYFHVSQCTAEIPPT